MAGGGEDETHGAGENLGGRIGRGPGRDVVLAGRQEIGRRLDLGEVDRHPVELDAVWAARLDQLVVLVHGAQIEAVHGRRHARGIGVPVEQVEGEGVLAEQVVVHHEGPDEVVGAQHVEGGGHGRAFEIAAFAHAFFEGRYLLLVDEDLELAGLLEVDHGGEEGRALDAVVLLRRQIAQRAGEQGAAQAVADDIGLALAGRLFHRVERRQRPFRHVVFEPGAGELLVGVDPGDDEDRMSAIDGPLDEGVLLAQIEDIELVDPGRDDQERPLEDLLRGGRILDELDQLVLKDHLAGREGDVDADFEGLVVGHLDVEPALTPVQVVEQVL